MSKEETAELLASLPKAPSEPQVLQLAAGLNLELAKKGAKFSVASKAKLDAAHQAALDAHDTLGKALGAVADCWKDNDVENSAQVEMTKLQGETTEALAKVATLEADLQKAQAENATLTAKVAKLEDLPEPAKGLLKILIDKADEVALNGDVSPEEELRKIEAMPNGPEKAQAHLKFIYRSGSR
jgi:hypothetical protein